MSSTGMTLHCNAGRTSNASALFAPLAHSAPRGSPAAGLRRFVASPLTCQPTRRARGALQTVRCDTTDGPPDNPDAEVLTIDVAGKQMTIETGEVARQAGGAVMARVGDTVILATACCSHSPSGDGSFCPFTVNYGERYSAAGRTSGGFLKRDGRPKDRETLICRLVDRPLRPMMPKGWANETQVLEWTLSYDSVHTPEPLAITAAGAALALSEVPLSKPVSGVRVGWLEGAPVINPTQEQMDASVLDLLMAGTEDGILMIEGYCNFMTEEDMLVAVEAGMEVITTVCAAVSDFAERLGKEKNPARVLPPSELEGLVRDMVGEDLTAAYRVPLKQERGAAVDVLRKSVKAQLLTEGDDDAGELPDGTPFSATHLMQAFKAVESATMRRLVLEEGVRPDGRGVTTVRDIRSRANVLPRTHGSALFTRGETQALCVATLGSSKGRQPQDSIVHGDDHEGDRFYLQYFFPPSCVGETGRTGGASRREIGHAMLAQRSLAPAIPSEVDFPYSMRVESNITESNGSSSMASVCGGCLALLDAGVPLVAPVAGVAMGLVLEPDGSFQVLTDILGAEDALGDMDFKVAGSADRVTAFQMDIKVEGITVPILREALKQARDARCVILDRMLACKPAPRSSISTWAAKLRGFDIPLEKVGAVIGPGGKMIKAVKEATGCEINVNDADGVGRVEISGTDPDMLDRAEAAIKLIAVGPEIGTVYRQVPVDGTTTFGAFVELGPGVTGLVHINELDVARVKNPDSVVSTGDLVDVVVQEVNGSKIGLSRKAVMLMDGVEAPPPDPDAPEPRKMTIATDKVGALFGQRGDTIRQIQASTGTRIDVEKSDGAVTIIGDDVESLDKAQHAVELVTKGPQEGMVFREAAVVGVTNFGCFVELCPGLSGMVHVSEMDTVRVSLPEDKVSNGDLVDVMVIKSSAPGKISLSMKRVMQADAKGKKEAEKNGDGEDDVAAPGTPTASETTPSNLV